MGEGVGLGWGWGALRREPFLWGGVTTELAERAELGWGEGLGFLF